MPTPPRRRWYLFSLRTMFVVVTVAALLAFGQWMVMRHRAGLLRDRNDPELKRHSIEAYEKSIRP